MTFPEQILLALISSLALVYPIYFMLRKKYKSQGKSIKYLIPKLCIFIVTPILSIPVLLSDVFDSLEKLVLIIVTIIGGLANYYSTTLARKSFRKVLGLPPEDEDTGEVIKDEKKEE
jgi:hypothetical protein